MKSGHAATRRRLGWVLALLLLSPLGPASAGPEPAANTAAPPFGGWLVLDGEDDYADAQSHAELTIGTVAGSSWTVEGWINYARFSDAGIVTRTNSFKVTMSVNSYSNPWTYCFWALWYTPTSGPWGISRCSYPAYPRNVWHHIAAVADGSMGRLTLYLDGERIARSESYGGILNDSGEPLLVGASIGYTGEWLLFTGMMDEVRISDVTRYDEDTFAVPSGPFACDAHTLALWHFDEPSGSTVFHDACGAADNVLVGHDGAHTEGASGSRVYLPIAFRQ